MPLPVAIIGGGISGLTAAFFLKKRGIPAVVIEPEQQLGGLLRTDYLEGCTVEAGADSWLAAKPWARALAIELGLQADLIGSNDVLRGVQVRRRGKFVPFPRGMQLIVPKTLRTVWTAPLFNLKTKLRMTADWRRTDAGPRPDRSVAVFIRDHFGQNAVDYLAEPLLSGIYGGDPEQLSANSVLPKLVAREALQGSLTRGLSQDAKPSGPVFESLRGGLGRLIAALKPETVLRGAAESIVPEGNRWRVRIAGEWLAVSQVVVACPAHRAAPIVCGSLGALLGTIQHSSAHIVAMAFHEVAPLSGFGVLIPRKEGLNLTALTFVSNKFLNRVPPGLQLIRAFFRQRPSDSVQDVRQLLRIGKQPVFVQQYSWPLSLPQYQIGHSSLVARISAEAAKFPGLHLIGNAYQGVGIPDCVKLASHTATVSVRR